MIEANRQILTVSAPSVQSSQMSTRKANTRNRFLLFLSLILLPLCTCYNYYSDNILCSRSSDSTSAQPTPSTTPVISSSSDTTAEEAQNDCANSSSSNEWGACRLRQRRSTNRTNSLPFKSTSFRHTRSSDNIIQTPPPPSSSTPSTTISTNTTSTSTPVATAGQEVINTSIASQESTSSENEDVLRTAVIIIIQIFRIEYSYDSDRIIYLIIDF